MAINVILAHFVCDGCGQSFVVEIDPAYSPPGGWTAFDIACDAVRRSVGYTGPNSISGLGGCSSVQGGNHLCGRCTSEADSEPGECDQ